MKPSVLIGVVIVFLIPIVALVVTHSSNPSTVTASPSPSPTPTNYTVPADAVSATKVTLQTDKGNITLDLFPDTAPLAVRNFVTLGKRGYYNGTFFHRILQTFMIQGGDPTGTGTGGQSIYGQGFATELGSRKFTAGSLGMARTADPNSNGSQFFIVTEGPQTQLDGQYTLFGQVDDAASMAVVTAIAATPTTCGAQSCDSGAEQSVPTQQIHITGFQIIQ